MVRHGEHPNWNLNLFNMRVKIIKCGKSTFWYNNYVGEVFEVTQTPMVFENHESNYSCTGTFAGNFICVCDAEVVSNTTYGDSKLKHYFV